MVHGLGLAASASAWLCSSSPPVLHLTLSDSMRTKVSSCRPHSQTTDNLLTHSRLQKIFSQKNDLSGEYETSQRNLGLPN